MEDINLFNKHCELYEKYTTEKEAVDAIIDNWLSGNSNMTAADIQAFEEKADAKLAILKAQADKAWEEFKKNEKTEEEAKSALSSVRHNFGVSPKEMIITGGVASSNASETHLIGRNKTPEELEQERAKLLGIIKARAMSREITLTEASKLKSDVNMAYDTTIAEFTGNNPGGLNK